MWMFIENQTDQYSLLDEMHQKNLVFTTYKNCVAKSYSFVGENKKPSAINHFYIQEWIFQYK